jgi:hypothetical protein
VLQVARAAGALIDCRAAGPRGVLAAKRTMTPIRERPWLRFYGKVPASIEDPRITPYEAVAATAQRSPQAIAWEFFGTVATYRELLASIDRCAAALASLGLQAGDRLLFSMPTARPASSPSMRRTGSAWCRC